MIGDQFSSIVLVWGGFTNLHNFIFDWHLDQSILKHPKFDSLHWWLTRRLWDDLRS